VLVVIHPLKFFVDSERLSVVNRDLGFPAKFFLLILINLSLILELLLGLLLFLLLLLLSALLSGSSTRTSGSPPASGVVLSVGGSGSGT
jgi:hypothetical protein